MLVPAWLSALVSARRSGFVSESVSVSEWASESAWALGWVSELESVSASGLVWVSELAGGSACSITTCTFLRVSTPRRPRDGSTKRWYGAGAAWFRCGARRGGRLVAAFLAIAAGQEPIAA
jgi:hypothetical protein